MLFFSSVAPRETSRQVEYKGCLAQLVERRPYKA